MYTNFRIGVMQALTLIEFGSFRVETQPEPAPGPGEVLVQITATGICGSDIHGFTGHNGRRHPGQVMGHETAGRIAGLGPGTDAAGLTVGQAVTFNPVLPCGKCEFSASGDWQYCPDRKVIGVDADLIGAFAEYVVVPQQNVVPLDPDLPVHFGALAEPLAVALHAAQRAGIRDGDRVLIVGGGPIGQVCVIAALRRGAAEVVVSEIDPARRDLCARLGAKVIDPSAESVTSAIQERFGALADVTIDAVGLSATLADALASTRYGGTVCLVGMGSPELSLRAFEVSVAERSLIGTFTYAAGDFRDAVTYLSELDRSVLDALVSRIVSLSDAQDEFTALGRNDGPAGKVLVRLAAE